jgi:hypothetical protein
VTAWSQTRDSSLPKLPLRVCSVAKVMSVARPRPRPKPRRPEALKSAPQASSSTGVCASSPAARRLQELEDEDALFLRNKSRTARDWKRLNKVNKGLFFLCGIQFSH